MSHPQTDKPFRGWKIPRCKNIHWSAVKLTECTSRPGPEAGGLDALKICSSCCVSRPPQRELSPEHRRTRFDGFLATTYSWTRLPDRVHGSACVADLDDLGSCMSAVTPSRAPRRNTCFASLVSGATSVSSQAPSARGAPAERGGSPFELLSLFYHDEKATACCRRALLPSHRPFAPLDPPAVIGTMTRRCPPLGVPNSTMPFAREPRHLVAVPGPGSCMLLPAWCGGGACACPQLYMPLVVWAPWPRVGTPILLRLIPTDRLYTAMSGATEAEGRSGSKLCSGRLTHHDRAR